MAACIPSSPELHDICEGVIERVFDRMLCYSSCNQSHYRYRACRLARRILANLQEEGMSDEVMEAAEFALIDRLTDKDAPVRLQAVHALTRLPRAAFQVCRTWIVIFLSLRVGLINVGLAVCMCVERMQWLIC